MSSNRPNLYFLMFLNRIGYSCLPKILSVSYCTCKSNNNSSICDEFGNENTICLWHTDQLQSCCGVVYSRCLHAKSRQAAGMQTENYQKVNVVSQLLFGNFFLLFYSFSLCNSIYYFENNQAIHV